MTDGAMLEADAGVFQSGGISQSVKLLRGVEGECEIKDCRVFGPEVRDDRVKQGGVERLPLNRAPDVERKPAPGGQHPRHLLGCRDPIWEILEALLTQHGVEAGIGEGKVGRATQMPVYASLIPSFRAGKFRDEHAGL